MAIKGIRGFSDILPPHTAQWQFCERRAREILEGFGFSEIRVPIMERTELFSRSIGEETDIVEKEMYTFEDRSGDRATLRPEATASIVRAYLEHKLYTDDPVAKLYSIGPMFRYERPQKGRYRQFHQINVEVFGIADPMIDAEVMAIVMHYLATVQATEYALQINSLGCSRCRPPYKKVLQSYLAEQKPKLCPDCQRRMKKNPLRTFDCKVAGCQEAMAGTPRIADHHCQECSGHFAAVRGHLEDLEVPYDVNPAMVRGLDYYTKTTFEVVAEGLGAQNAVAAGGRYDYLVKELGGPNIPGIGFAIGIERLLLILSEAPISQAPSLFIAAVGEKAQKEAFSLGYRLNKAGVCTMMDYEGRSLKSQMRRANKHGARHVLIIGEDEIKSGKVVLRDMEASEQQEIPLSTVYEDIAKRAQGGSL